MRREGLGRVIRDDVRRARAAARASAWRRTHSIRPNALPVFIVGIQRSGTDMMINAFRESPELEVHNESKDSKAFRGYQLRSDPVIRRLVEASGHRCVVFKALCDSHRVVRLLDELGTPSRGRAIWAYRKMEGRVRSTITKWPRESLWVLQAIANGTGTQRWEAQGLSHENLELIAGFDYERMSPESAAALLWYVRNSLFVDLGLPGRDDVRLVSYEAIVREPEAVMRSICEFLGIGYNERMTAHISPRPPATQRALDIDPQIRARCDELEHRFDEMLGGSEDVLFGAAGIT